MYADGRVIEQSFRDRKPGAVGERKQAIGLYDEAFWRLEPIEEVRAMTFGTSSEADRREALT